jgi:FtsZ-binding cell division protein ZapB
MLYKPYTVENKIQKYVDRCKCAIIEINEVREDRSVCNAEQSKTKRIIYKRNPLETCKSIL